MTLSALTAAAASAATLAAGAHAPSARLTFVLHRSIAGPQTRVTRVVACAAGSRRCAAIDRVRTLLLAHHGCASNDTGLISVTGRIGARRVATFYGGCAADRRAWSRVAAAAGVRF